jgi:ribosome-binding protein aMBF1 (putative translation factor)
MHRLRADNGLDWLIHFDKLRAMAASNTRPSSPAGARAADAAASRARRHDDYRAAREEYAAIEQLREVNWIAAHIRERRYELELTQQQVADRAGTSHSFVSKLESGTHIPTIPVLTRIFAVLDERLLIGIERDTPDGEPEREIAAVPNLIAA